MDMLYIGIYNGQKLMLESKQKNVSSENTINIEIKEKSSVFLIRTRVKSLEVKSLDFSKNQNV